MDKLPRMEVDSPNDGAGSRQQFGLHGSAFSHLTKTSFPGKFLANVWVPAEAARDRIVSSQNKPQEYNFRHKGNSRIIRGLVNRKSTRLTTESERRMDNNAESLLTYRKQHYGFEPKGKFENRVNILTSMSVDLSKSGDELIDWELRWKTEGNFFIEELRSRGVKRVLGCRHRNGIPFGPVVGSWLRRGERRWQSLHVISRVRERPPARAMYYAPIRPTGVGSIEIANGRFDAVICLGNSFTHLFREVDRRKTLAEFYAALVYDGLLILDQRNYDSILDNGFSTKHKYYYCGEKVSAAPEHVDEGLARFRYDFADGTSYHLNMFPLRKDYTRRLIKEAGFPTVHTYGDFMETYHEDDPGLLHSCRRESLHRPS